MSSDANSPTPFEREDAEVELGNGDSLSERMEKLRAEGTERLSAEEIVVELGLEQKHLYEPFRIV